MSEAKVDVALGNYSAKPLRKKVGVDGVWLDIVKRCHPICLEGCLDLLSYQITHVKAFYISVVYTLQMLQEF